MRAADLRTRQTRVVRAGLRFLAIAATATACALASTGAAIAVHFWSLPPSDGAYGLTMIEVWADPAVQSVALVAFALGFVVGAPLAEWILWPTKLKRSLPVVFAATIATAFLTGGLMPLTPLLTLAAGVVTMTWCRRRFPVSSPRA